MAIKPNRSMFIKTHSHGTVHSAKRLVVERGANGPKPKQIRCLQNVARRIGTQQALSKNRGFQTCHSK
jgi:hypothetical protein